MRNLILVFILAAVAIGLTVYLVANDSSMDQTSSADSRSNSELLPVEDVEQRDNRIASDYSVDSGSESLQENSNLIGDIVRSVDDADRDTKDAAVLAVENEMTHRQKTYPNGWVRWRPVLIDEFDLTNGDYLDIDAVVSEFVVSPFPDRSYRATRTNYRPRESTASATWEGVLDDGESGTVKISIMDTTAGVEVRIRLSTPDGQFNIMPTEEYGVYVASESDASFWSTQRVEN